MTVTIMCVTYGFTDGHNCHTSLVSAKPCGSSKSISTFPSLSGDGSMVCAMPVKQRSAFARQYSTKMQKSCAIFVVTQNTLVVLGVSEIALQRACEL